MIDAAKAEEERRHSSAWFEVIDTRQAPVLEPEVDNAVVCASVLVYVADDEAPVHRLGCGSTTLRALACVGPSFL